MTAPNTKWDAIKGLEKRIARLEERLAEMESDVEAAEKNACEALGVAMGLPADTEKTDGDNNVGPVTWSHIYEKGGGSGSNAPHPATDNAELLEALARCEGKMPIDWRVSDRKVITGAVSAGHLIPRPVWRDASEWPGDGKRRVFRHKDYSFDSGYVYCVFSDPPRQDGGQFRTDPLEDE